MTDMNAEAMNRSNIRGGDVLMSTITQIENRGIEASPDLRLSRRRNRLDTILAVPSQA